MYAITRLHNLRQPNGRVCAFAPITRETTAFTPDATLCGREATGAWDHAETSVNCPACVAVIDAEHAVALVSQLVTLRSGIAAQFLREGDLIEVEGCVFRVDFRPPVEDGMVFVPVSVFDEALCVEVPVAGPHVTTVMYELVPADLDDVDLAVAA
jgi:hypothetical protein